MKKLSMCLVIVSIIAVFLAVIASPTLKDQGANAAEPKRIAPASSAQTNWRADYQKAYNFIREHRNDKDGGTLVKMETELKASEKTMIAAEQLLNKKPINKQAADSMVAKIDNHKKNLNNLTYGGITIPTTTTTGTTTPLTTTTTPTTTTMTQIQIQMQNAAIMSNILRQMHAMQMSIISNIR